MQRWSRTLIPTSKQAPGDAEAPSHILLARGGFIRRVAAGVYDYLPLAWRTLRKIEGIVRDELNAAGASELLLPAVAPMDLLELTGRADEYGDLLFSFTDRHNRDVYLGPTHEEVITDLARGTINSYKQLPLNLYQIQTKFRDEFRPRAGLLRCREFIMKDAYSFHMDVDGPGGLGEGYDAMYSAYENIFTRCGLDFSIVEAEAGPIGGSASHEFMVNCESGEDTILTCPATGYAANVEKCEIGERAAPSKGWFGGGPSGNLDKVHTPECPGIEEVCKFLKVKPRHMLKTVVFEVEEFAKIETKFVAGDGKISLRVSREQQVEEMLNGPDSGLYPHFRWVVAVVRGDHEVNEGKVRDLIGHNVVLAESKCAEAAGFSIGYVSPRAPVKTDHCFLLVDRDAAVGFDDNSGKPMFWVTGGDEQDYHVKHFNWGRDLGSDAATESADASGFVRVGDVRNAEAGDPSPRDAGATLEAHRGIEVGHIFKLGDKYSRAMDFAIMDEKQERRPVVMGCYGIGVSRTLAACVEMSHDENGIVWPMALAPYHVIITVMKADDANAIGVADNLAGELADAGFDVLIDDRDERAGVKFKDADLIGVPIRLTIGDRALAEDSVEFKLRADPGKGELVKMSGVVAACQKAAG